MTSPGLLSEGTPPNSGTVTIHYTLFLEHQDEPYDSTKLRGQCERFKLDDHRLLPGIEIAIKSMCKKEKASFMIQPEYAFGQMGCPPRIPENAQILAKIELLDFVQEAEAEALLAIDPTERSKARTFSEIMAIARKENLEGNSAVKEGEWKMAAKRYNSYYNDNRG